MPPSVIAAQDLLRIARAAATLDERIAAFAAGAAADPDQEGARLLEQWFHLYSSGDRDAFRRRLSWDGLDETRARAAVAADSIPAALPGWTAVLEAALAAGGPVADEIDAGREPAEAGTPGQPYRFAHLWVPWLRVARRRLQERNGLLAETLSIPAARALETHLLRGLSTLSESTLFEVFTAAQLPYRRFVTEFLRAEAADFFATFPALARRAAELVENWIDLVDEFVIRLEADRRAIATLLAGDADPGPIAALGTGVSDRHHGNRQILIVTFESGLRVVYKPRPVSLERAYNEFLRWLARAGVPSPPPAVTVIDRGSYGWVEFVEQTPAGSADDVHRYYRAAGGLLTLAHLLGGNDLHMENIIAAAGGPVLVDAESLLQPLAHGRETGGSAMDAANRRVQDSFLSTGLLSLPQTDANGAVYDIGGLCGCGGYVLATPQRVWKDVNTDTMRMELESAVAPEEKNVLRLRGERQHPEDFIADLIAGFEGMYRFLIERRGEVERELRRLAGLPTRVIFRPSNVYAAVLVHIASPRYFRDGAVRSFAIDAINRVFRRSPARPPLWPLVAEERAALERLDIPYFSIATDAVGIRTGSGDVVPDLFARTGLGASVERLKGYDGDDLVQQRGILRATLVRSENTRAAAADAGRGAVGRRSAGPDELIAGAVAIAETLRRNAIRGDDGAATWIAPDYLRMAEREDRGVAYYLYHGASGIALFLAAAGAVTGEKAYAELAHAAIDPIARVFGDPQVDALLRHEHVGACNGLGSVVYSLAVVSRLLGDARHLPLAFEIAGRITDPRISADDSFDVEAGAAGAILGLLALHTVLPEARLLERAAACGEHLLRHRREGEKGGFAWPAPDGLMLAGMAHGAAGIGMALARLAEVTGRGEFAEAAREARDYERTVFDPADGNWPVLTGDERGSVPMKAWCHGAPGVGLARLGLPRAGADPEAVRDIETAMATTATMEFSSTDHLCCGNAGQAEALLCGGLRFGREEWVDAGRHRIASTLDRARGLGRYTLRLNDAENEVLIPGFFRGISGVGYELLRYAAPERLPSVLMFEV